MTAAYTLAGLVGDRLESADSDEREKLAPQIGQLLRALPARSVSRCWPRFAALAREEAASAHLASLAAALPAADVLRGLRRLAREQGQLSSHALQMAQALAEAHEEMGTAPAALPEPPADFAEMAALFREEDVDRYNPEDHRALLAQKPTVDLDAIAVEIAADPDAFGPDTERRRHRGGAWCDTARHGAGRSRHRAAAHPGPPAGDLHSRAPAKPLHESSASSAPCVS
jgi:hypothetical protein